MLVQCSILQQCHNLFNGVSFQDIENDHCIFQHQSKDTTAAYTAMTWKQENQKNPSFRAKNKIEKKKNSFLPRLL